MVSFKEFYRKFLTENVSEGVKTSDSKSDKFEVKITENIRKFIDNNRKNIPSLEFCEVSHSTDEDAKYFSDILVSNNGNNVWIEVKLNKYAELGGPSYKYIDGKWTCTTGDDPLMNYYLELLDQNSGKFIDFCRQKLGDDFRLPKDLPDVMDQWKSAGMVDDTDNDVLFITEKIEIEDFGKRITDFYVNTKNERVYYIQVGRNLYILDRNYNPLALKTRDGGALRTFEEAHRKGRIQFRAKRLQKKLKDGTKDFYNITCDIKILADDEFKDDGQYFCSFDEEIKFPIIDLGNTGDLIHDDNTEDGKPATGKDKE